VAQESNVQDGVIAEPASDASIRYSKVAIFLHWLIAAAFAFQIGLGWQLEGPNSPQIFAAYQLHKSIGITILLLTLARLAWRLTHRPPALPDLPTIERVAASAVHILFYILLICLPLSGWLVVSSSKVEIPTFLYGTIPWPHLPGVGGLGAAAKAGVNDAAGAAHEVMVWIALAAIVLHILGALKHQLFERGDFLARMAPVSTGRKLGGIALLIVVVFVGVMSVGRTIRLAPIAPIALAPAPASAPAPVAAPPAEAPTAPPADVAAPVETPTEPAADVETAAIVPSKWTVRMASSSIAFRSKWSQGPIDGSFGKWRADIAFDPKALAASTAIVTIDMASVTAADSEQASDLPGTDWFAVATHPTAVWKTKSFRHTGGDNYVAAGTLTLRGVSKPLAIAFTLTIKNDVATMTGSTKIDRTLFGVGQGEWAVTTDVPALVSVAIAIKADRSSAGVKTGAK
jgi:cytochrome b561/polyisoprenoid-binding protein YceI